MQELTDDQLMEKVAAGDREAFAVLVDRYKDTLVNYLTRVTRCRDRAEDLAQDAFLRLYTSAQRYGRRGRLGAYLFRIATNLMLSEERRNRRWHLLAAAFSSNGDRPEPSPQSRLLQSEATETVSNALAELPIHYRAPLVLREIEGWSYQSIAQALGCREGTVKSRINRGRGQLRELLQPYQDRGAR